MTKKLDFEREDCSSPLKIPSAQGNNDWLVVIDQSWAIKRRLYIFSEQKAESLLIAWKISLNCSICIITSIIQSTDTIAIEVIRNERRGCENGIWKQKLMRSNIKQWAIKDLKL